MKKKHDVENGRTDDSTKKRMGRREFLVNAAKGVFLISVTPYFQGCEYEEMLAETASTQGSGGDSGTEKFYFAVLSDTHIKETCTATQNEIMALTVDILNSHSPDIDFVMVTGDCVDYLPSDDYDYFFNTTTALDILADFKNQLNMPFYPVMGNHDYYTKKSLISNVTSDKAIREQVFSEKLETPGPYYSFEHNGVKFYCLNSMQDNPDVDWEPELVGSFGPTQLLWLEEELQDEKPAFFFHHHPLATDRTVVSGYSGLVGFPFEIPRAEKGFRKYENWNKIYRLFGSILDAAGLGDFDYTDPIYDILKTNNEQIKAVFFGHTHLFLEDTCEGIPVFMTDAMKAPRYFLYDQTDTMRYHIIECEADTGNFSIYNEVEITYINDLCSVSGLSVSTSTSDDAKAEGLKAFIEFLKERGVAGQIIDRLL